MKRVEEEKGSSSVDQITAHLPLGSAQAVTSTPPDLMGSIVAIRSTPVSAVIQNC